MEHKSVANTRKYLAIMIVLLVVIVAAMAVPIPAAMAVFDKLLPVLMLILGYYFGQNGAGR